MAKSKKKTKPVDLDDDPIEDIDEMEDDDGGDGADSIDEPASPPARTPKLTKTVIAFILLNWLAVPTFLYFAYVNHIARSQYAGHALMNHIRIWGLPLESEEDFPSGSNVTREYVHLTADQLKDAFKRRGGTGVPAKEPFVPVEEAVQLRLRPSDLRPSALLPAPPLLDDIFGKLGDPVPTLEEEMIRLSKKAPEAIEAAAKEAADKLKTDDEKRELVRKVLLPIAWNIWQIKRTFPDPKAPADLDETISMAKGADLDTLVNESLQRRMYYDILAPINVFRPGDLSKAQIEKIADQKVPIAEVKGFLVKRLIKATEKSNDPDIHIGDVLTKERTDAEDRDSIEKRHTIAFIMFALGQATAPTLDKKLFPKGMERAEVVCGLREYTGASVQYVRSLRVLEERIAQSIVANRDGRAVKMPAKDELITLPTGFIHDYENEVDRLVKLIDYIAAAQKRLDNLKGQRDEYQKLHTQRAKQHKDTLDKLLEARKKTVAAAAELREFQDQLHKALVELSDAGERNFALEMRIRAITEDWLLKNQAQPKKKKGAQR